MRSYEQCTDTCTVDCGHCKGAGRPTREALAVEFITGYTRARGFAPTVRELGEAVGLTSSSSAAALVDRLVQAGAVRRTPGIPRSLVVVAGAA